MSLLAIKVTFLIISQLLINNIPTAGDIDREPVDPVGEGVGLIPWEFGVPGPAGPFELSLLF